MKRLALSSILALGLAFSLTACGGDSADGGGGDSAASGPVGTWVLDVAAFKEDLSAAMEKDLADKPDDEAALMREMLKPMFAMFDEASMEMTLKDDGTWVGTGKFPDAQTKALKDEVSKGTWSIDGNAITLTTTERNGEADDSGEDVLSGTIDGAVIRVKSKTPMDPGMTLRRK